MEAQGLRIHIHSPDDIGISTTPEEVWRAAKPDSIVEIEIPYDVDPAERQAILDMIGDNPLVYVRHGLPGEHPPGLRAQRAPPVQRAREEERGEWPEIEAHVWAKLFSVIVLVLLIGASDFNIESAFLGQLFSGFPLLVVLVFCLVVLL